jgi:hypothetical protein
MDLVSPQDKNEARVAEKSPLTDLPLFHAEDAEYAGGLSKYSLRTLRDFF